MSQTQNVCEQIESLLEELRSWNWEKTHAEQENFVAYKALMILVAEHPLDLCKLTKENQEALSKIVQTYLDTCFGDGNMSWW